MNTVRFKSLLAESDLEVTFVKKTDGTVRTIKCSSNVPSEFLKEAAIEERIKPEGMVVVFDTESRSWKSFYVDCIVSVRILNSSFGMLTNSDNLHGDLL